MKIVHVISSPAAGGAEIYVKDISLELYNRGHSVHIAFLETAADCGRDDVYEKEFLAQLSDGGITYSFIGHQSRKRPWVGIHVLNKMIKDLQPDLMHCHLYYAAVFSVFVPGVPVVYTHHSIKLRAPKVLYKLLDLRISSYIGICLACTKMLTEVTSKNVVRIDNAVSVKRLQPTCFETYPAARRLRLVCVGRIVSEKNYDLLISACQQLSDLDFEVVIAGEGPGLSRLKQMASDMAMRDKLLFIGNISNIPSLLASADIFVMSSAFEGLPISLLEASVLGLPAVVTNVGGCAEVLHALCSGIVVDESTPACLATALRRMITDDEMRSGFARNAVKYASHYSIARAVDKHLNLYESLV